MYDELRVLMQMFVLALCEFSVITSESDESRWEISEGTYPLTFIKFGM